MAKRTMYYLKLTLLKMPLEWGNLGTEFRQLKILLGINFLKSLMVMPQW